MSQTSDTAAKFYEPTRKNDGIITINFPYSLNVGQVADLKKTIGVKHISTGTNKVPAYKHLIARLTAESIVKIVGGMTKHIDIEEGVKADENLLTVFPKKAGFKGMTLRTCFPEDELFFKAAKDDFIKVASNPEKVKHIKNRFGYDVRDIIIDPLEFVPVEGKHKVRFAKDVMYYVPWPNAIANFDDGDVLIAAGWTLGVGEHFGEIIVTETTTETTEVRDYYGRVCLKWQIIGEEHPKYHPQWNLPLGYVKGTTSAFTDEYELTVDSAEAYCDSGVDVYAFITPYLNLNGDYAVRSIRKVSEAEYLKNQPTAYSFDEQKARARTKRGESDYSGSETASECGSERPPKKALTIGQMAARVDVNYKDPRVTQARIGQFILDNYPEIEIGEKAEMEAKIFDLVAKAMLDRKVKRPEVTQAVLDDWAGYCEPQGSSTGVSHGVSSMFIGARKWAAGVATAAGKGVTKPVTKRAEKVATSYKANGFVAAIMPILALIALVGVMLAACLMIGMFTLKMWRGTTRAMGWIGTAGTIISGLSALGDAPPTDFIERAKDFAATMGAVTGAITGTSAPDSV